MVRRIGLQPRQVQTRRFERTESLRKIVLPDVAHCLHAPPQLSGGLLHLLHQGSRGHDGKIQPRLIENAVVGVIPVVQDVDAATKSQLPIDHTQLAVQAAPSTWYQQTQRTQRRIDPPLHAGIGKALTPGIGHWRSTHPIDHHPDPHTPGSGAQQSLGHLSPGTIEIKNIGLKLHVRARAVQSLDQGCKKFLAAFQQTNLMAVAYGMGGTHGAISRNGTAPPKAGGPTCGARCDHAAPSAPQAASHGHTHGPAARWASEMETSVFDFALPHAGL